MLEAHSRIVERASPVDGRLAARERSLWLDALALLFAGEAQPGASPLARRADGASWCDPATGHLRRNPSPSAFASSLDPVEVVLPPQAHVAHDTGSRAGALDQRPWVLEGSVEVTNGEAVHDLGPGDGLAMRVGDPTSFRNPGNGIARYLVALVTTGRGPA